MEILKRESHTDNVHVAHRGWGIVEAESSKYLKECNSFWDYGDILGRHNWQFHKARLHHRLGVEENNFPEKLICKLEHIVGVGVMLVPRTSPCISPPNLDTQLSQLEMIQRKMDPHQNATFQKPILHRAQKMRSPRLCLGVPVSDFGKVQRYALRTRDHPVRASCGKFLPFRTAPRHQRSAQMLHWKHIGVSAGVQLQQTRSLPAPPLVLFRLNKRVPSSF